MRSRIRGRGGGGGGFATAIGARDRDRDRDRERGGGRVTGAAAGPPVCFCIMVKRSFSDNTVDPFKWTFFIDDISIFRFVSISLAGSGV